MSDLSAAAVLPKAITSFGKYAPAHTMRGLAVAAQPNSNTWPAVNQATYIPFRIPFYFPIAAFSWANGSVVAAGNCDIGVYTLGGVRLVSTGSTAQAGASLAQTVTLGSIYLLAPGSYYLALSCSGTLNAIVQNVSVTTEPGRHIGLLQQASALPLPATATFAAWASTGYPACGFSR